VSSSLDKAALAQLFIDARTHNGWNKKPVPEATLKALWDLARMGPTAANCSPMRVVFVTTPEGKERLRPALDEGNVEKTMNAPATAIVAYDTAFYDHLPTLFPHADARSWFAGNAAHAAETAFRNGSLQGGYLIMAARSLGLDCGPMSGFNPDKLNAAFFPDGRFKANFLCNLGYGDPSKLYPRSPRLAFEEACRIV